LLVLYTHSIYKFPEGQQKLGGFNLLTPDRRTIAIARSIFDSVFPLFPMRKAPHNGHHRKEILRGVLAVSIIIVGITHFLRPEQYARIVPPPFPPLASVYVSGFFEILGGIGLVIPFVSVAAAWGLISLFIAVFPANIYMTLHNIKIEGIPHNQALYWARLPVQAVFIAWAYWYTRQPETQLGASQVAAEAESLSQR